MKVFAIRHGETEWSLSGQHTGTTDIALTENGRRRAEQIRPVLAKETFELVLVSPTQRALDTCRLAGLGHRAVIDPDLERPQTQLSVCRTCLLALNKHVTVAGVAAE